MARQRIPTKQAPRDAKQYLEQLEQLLKRNTGTGTFIGQDTSSNIPMYLPGRVANPTGLSETPSTRTYGNGMQAPTPVERPEPEVYQEPQQGDLPIDAESFLTQLEEVYNQVQPGTQGMDQTNPGAMATGVENTADGGVLFSDGIIYYSDGTFRSGESDAQPIATDASGGTRYSDGSIRMSYEQIGLPQQSMPGGLTGLISGIFGQDRTITQEYGNYNPSLEPGSGYNLGTDIRTRDLTGSQRQYKLPVGAEVVQVLYDDGTRFGDQSGHQGYGNSVLLRLPSGEMLRFSHMSQMADLQEGMRLQPGQVFGVPGQTGNTAGEHLDLEYYNQAGQLSDPTGFSGFTNPRSLAQPKLFSSVDDPQAPTTQPQQQFSQQSVEQQTQQPQMPTPMTDAVSGVVNAPKNVFNKAKEAIPSVEEIKQANPIEGEFGVTEGLVTPQAEQARISALSQQPKQYNPFRQLAGNITERIGDTLGIPEGAMSEAIAGGATKRTNVALADEIGAERPEAVPGIRQNIKDIGGQIKTAGQEAIGQAGEGIKALGQKGISSLENVFAPKQEVAKRAVGDVAGTAETDTQSGQFSSVMDTAQSMANLPKNDIRDPFFKYGGSETYKNFLKPNAESAYGGALTLDLFNNDFFKDLGNISSVFGGSKDLGTATDKYIGYEKEKYKPMDRMNYEEGYDRGEIDNYNRQVDEYNNSLNKYFNDIRSSVSGSQSIYTPAPMSSSKNIFASSAPKVNMSIAPNMSVVSPQFYGANMSVSKPNMSVNRPNASAPNMSVNRPAMSVAPAPAARVSGPMSLPSGRSQGGMSVAPKPAPRMSVAPKPAPQMSVAPRMSVAPKNVGTQSKPTSNVFSKVTSAIKNIFRR